MANEGEDNKFLAKCWLPVIQHKSSEKNLRNKAENTAGQLHAVHQEPLKVSSCVTVKLELYKMSLLSEFNFYPCSWKKMGWAWKPRLWPIKTNFYACVCLCVCVSVQKPALGVYKPAASTWCVLRSPSPDFKLCSGSLPFLKYLYPPWTPPTVTRNYDVGLASRGRPHRGGRWTTRRPAKSQCHAVYWEENL